MRLNRSDRLVLLFFMAVVLAMWAGVLLDRWFLQPRSSMVRLDEAGMDSLEAEWGGADCAALSGHGSPMSNGSSSSEYYAVPVQQPETFPFDPNTAIPIPLTLRRSFVWALRLGRCVPSISIGLAEAATIGLKISSVCPA